MKKRKKSKWLNFILGMVIYALVVILAASIGLKLLWNYAAEYESARPTYKINDYVSSLNETHVKRIAYDFVASLDHNIQNDDTAYAEIWRAFVAGVRYRQLSVNDDGQSITYIIYNKERELGKVTLINNGEGLGDKTWSVGEESYDFSFLKRTDRFIVPNHWVVRCGDRRLGVEYIIDHRVEYSFLHEFYDREFPMPYLAEYEISNYIGDPNVRFFNADGEEQERFTLTDGRDQILRVSGASKSKFISFTETFVPLYVNCLSNVTKSAGTNYQRIRPYLVPDGELDVRLRAAFEGQLFSQSNGTDISDVSIHDIFNLGNEYFIVDLSYTVDTYSAKGVSASDTSMYLVIYRDDEDIRALTVSYY